ncbi:ADP-ribosylglycohydrolase family protein [Bacteriovorax sp. PP10]|uniref:ADP-ribosylglycohydrolase family protein n=1 Tax=Bacteriovorax antarcticus TaxID=3088717 RepID=A0ABU5VYV4_9BACT|nr:ADP-ribosylglycohydrolase family protein [Bacteriovorax sp. PP10]MEA9357767.1 ADP-ribosylglycohydrolase family protein [Bacteriovorax sp. PP10]
MIELKDRFLGCLLGLAVGDALGAPVEFKERGSFPPVEEMQAGGPFNLKKGQWTDDTSLALCLGTSLIEKKGFDPYDQVERYVKWFREGYMSCTGNCFDIGNTTKAALLRYEENKDIYAGAETDPATNGSLMRLAPIPLFYLNNLEDTIKYAGLSSKVTHAPLNCIKACEDLARFIHRALLGKSKEEIFADSTIDFKKSYEEVSGKGDALLCLEGAMWCFYHSASFAEGAKMAVNLGDDTDTTAAVFGQVAGAFYGVNSIPAPWLNDLWDKPMIENLALDLFNSNTL